MGSYHGIRTGEISSPFLTLEYLTEQAQRIVRLSLPGDARNLMAASPDFGWETPHGRYCIYGGHRLWHAPQVSGRTDVPDDPNLVVEPFDAGVRLTAPADPFSSIERRMEVRLDSACPEVHICHTLVNRGVWAVELAPWTVTQVPLGGCAVIPVADAPLGGNGSMPNRGAQFWPGVHLPQPRFEMCDRHFFYRVDAMQGFFKMGCFSPAGWMGYAWNGLFFRKRFEAAFGPAYPDGGCNVEVFSHDQYAELEALGPLVKLEPGEVVDFHETWELRRLQDVMEELDTEIQAALGQSFVN
jgi:hypothetical protein